MAISEAKLEANRRNAGKSTGPRTSVGKQRSSRNAVTHGLRAEHLIMVDEDPQELADRKEAWSASVLPRDDVEQSAVDAAVEHEWMRDRARRAQAARIAANIANAGVEEAKREADQVLRLGQKLFSDNRGPLAAYPHVDIENEGGKRVSESDLVDDPEDPQRLVLHLQATAGGCQWMLDQWSDLGTTLAKGLNWQSADKLKAVRLLGRHPMEAADDSNVLMVFLACQTMEGQPITVIPEIWNELRDYERKRYARRLVGRGIDRLAPEGVAAARQVLFDIVARETAQITVKADAHRRRAEVIEALTADILLFDDSPAGERLRRYELANGRAVWRALDALHKHRSATERTDHTVTDGAIRNGPSSVVSGPLSDLSVVSGPLPIASCTAHLIVEAEITNEPTATRESVTNDATIGPLSVVRCPLPVISCTACAGDGSAPIEPTPARENATNEATIGPLSVVSGPLPIASCTAHLIVESETANEATATRENVTNEATIGPLSVVSGPLPIASGTARTVDESETTNKPTAAQENAPNEPTAAQENAPNEPTAAQENAPNEPTMVGDFEERISSTSPRGSGERVPGGRVRGPVPDATTPARPTPAISTNQDRVLTAPASPSPPGGCGSHSADDGNDAESTELSAGTDDRDERNFEEGFSVPESESILKACERIRLSREEQVRKLNEEARREAEAAMIIRRFRLGGQKNKNGKPAGQLKARATQPGQNSKEEAAAPNPTELEQFVKTALAHSTGAHPPVD